MEALIKAMSNEDLVELKAKYADNPSVVTLIGGILETRGREAEEAKVVALRDRIFVKATDKILGELPEYSPEWRKDTATQAISITTIEVDDTSQEQVEVTVGGVEGEMEMRYPKMLIRKVSIGVAVSQVSKEKGEAKTNGSKRAVTVYKRNGTQLELIGNFPTGQACADYLKVPTGVSSANKVLRDDGYVVEPYEGTDYTA